MPENAAAALQRGAVQVCNAGKENGQFSMLCFFGEIDSRIN